MESLGLLWGGVVGDWVGGGELGGVGSGDSLAWWSNSLPWWWVCGWGWDAGVGAAGGVEWMDSVEEWVEGVLSSRKQQRMQLFGWRSYWWLWDLLMQQLMGGWVREWMGQGTGPLRG